MNRQAVWAVAEKDIRAIRESFQLWLPIVLLPIILCILLPGGLILAARYFDIQSMGNTDMIKQTIDALPEGAIRAALFQWDTEVQQMTYFFVVYLFTPFFLLIPVMISSVIAANSFVGEKERKTLESLLYTPVDMTSLFWGKILSAFIPSMVTTLVCAVLYALVVNWLGLGLFGRFILPQANWVVMLLLLVPAVSFFAIFVNIYISARVKGFQEAYQLGSLVVLPIVALLISQMAGLLFLSVPVLIVISMVVLLMDGVLVSYTAKQFDRNRLFATQVK